MQTALVIGASKGIGHGLVAQLIASGWQVTATTRDQASAKELTAMGAQVIHCDVLDENAWQTLTSQITQNFHQVFYVAGIFGPSSGSQTPPSTIDFNLVMQTNILGAMRAISALSSRITKTPDGKAGKFIFISSVMGSITESSGSMGWLYKISKAGLNMAVKAAVYDHPHIIFQLIHPGWVKTAMGGENAPITIQRSATGILNAVNALEKKHNGNFITFEGKAISW